MLLYVRNTFLVMNYTRGAWLSASLAGDCCLTLCASLSLSAAALIYILQPHDTARLATVLPLAVSCFAGPRTVAVVPQRSLRFGLTMAVRFWCT